VRGTGRGGRGPAVVVMMPPTGCLPAHAPPRSHHGDRSTCVSSSDSIDNGKNANNGRRAREGSSSLCCRSEGAMAGSIHEISPNRTYLPLQENKSPNRYLPKLPWLNTTSHETSKLYRKKPLTKRGDWVGGHGGAASPLIIATRKFTFVSMPHKQD
jgi:hypothetical protein